MNKDLQTIAGRPAPILASTMLCAVDVAHYYMGCMFKFTYNNGDIIYSKLGVLHNYGFSCGTVEWIEENGKIRKPTKDIDDWFEINDIKTDGKFELILTSTWDLTKAQNREYLELCYKVMDLHDGKSICRYADTPLSMRYLFINHVDAFDLIENKQAIDKSTVLHLFQ